MLEREREKTGPDGTYSSLWQRRVHPHTGHPSWFHIVTQREVFQEPIECKGAILADDVSIASASPVTPAEFSTDGAWQDNNLCIADSGDVRFGAFIRNYVPGGAATAAAHRPCPFCGKFFRQCMGDAQLVCPCEGKSKGL